MKRLQRLLVLLLTVVFVLPLFPISAAASGWSLFPWSAVFGEVAEQTYSEEAEDYPDDPYAAPYYSGDTVNDYMDPNDYGQPVDAGDTVSSYYGDDYYGSYDVAAPASDAAATENEAPAPDGSDAVPEEEEKDAEEKDDAIRAIQDELIEQTVTAAQPKPTKDVLSFKEMRTNRLDRLSDSAPARNELPEVTITIRGRLPQGATAKARYIAVADDLQPYGSALFAYEITVYDAFGTVYIPDSELTVTVASPLIATAVQDGMTLTVLRYTGQDDETEETDSESSGDLCRFRTKDIPACFVFTAGRPDRTVFSEYIPDPGKSAGEGGARVTVSGVLPAGVTAEVEPVAAEAYDVELGKPLLTFDVTLYRDGAEYQPDADRPATVTVRDPRIASVLDEGYTIAVWHIAEDGSCQRVHDVSASGDAVSFTAREFSPYVLGLAAREIGVFTDAYVEASLLGVDSSAAPQWDGSVEPELGDGLELIDACEVDCAGSGLWLNVALTDEPALGELESLTLYGVAGGELVEGVSAEVAGAGEIATIALDAADGFALVKDTGLRSRSLTADAEDDGSVTISGRMPVNATASAVTAEEEAEDAVCAYDISLFNNGKEYQPGEDNPLTVTIHNPAIADAVAAGRELALWHVGDGGEREEITSFTVEGDAVSFTATSFSIYEIIDAKAPPTVQDLNHLASEFDDPDGFILSYRNAGNVNYFFTNSLNGNSAFIETADMNAASIWYFEKVEGAENQYYVYTYVNGAKKYMKNTSGNLMGLVDNGGTAFELSQAAGGKFYFKVVGANKWLQHSNGGGGIRLYTDKNNAANSSITITYASSVGQEDDYYGLDGKTYGIAFHQESVKGAGMTAQTKMSGSQQRLEAVELLVRPDVLDYSGELLVAQNGDLTEWTFTWDHENYYYMTTQIGGTTKYLTLDGNSLRLADEPDPSKSLIKVESGSGEHKGKYIFSVGSYALTLPGGNEANGFASSNNGGDYSWLNLVVPTALEEDDFVIYSAEKVDISDRDKVPDGSEVVVYTRLWNEEKKKYEFYAINHDGKLIRCYESGDMIQWVGGAFNTALWDFTEYTYDDGTPNYYYELQSDYSGQYIAPQASDEQILSDSTIGINLNGRRFGYYYSTILAWDDQNYAYAGLKTEDGRVVSCPLDEAEVFYFAIMKEPEPEEQLTNVATIDHTQFGITMRMVNFPTRKYASDYLGNDDGGVGTILQPGLLSTELGADGYPTAAGGSLITLYTGAQEVNHLFIENTYYSSGYFEYDSTQNFATLGEDGNFTVYNELGTSRVTYSRESMQHSQFLPYNDLSDEYSVLNPYNLYSATVEELPDSDPRKGEPLYLVEGETDYYFGLEIEASFTQTANGNDAWGHDIIYEFTGDDDFWLYVDGELVIDLGGIHSAVPGSVNYRTGEVFVNGTYTTLRDVFYNNYLGRGHTAAEAEAYVNEKFEQNSDGQWVFKDYTTHTMKIFYMERGAGASNLHMRFNLASVKPGTVLLSKELDGIDSSESNIAEFPYQIFYMMEDQNAAGEAGQDDGAEDEERQWVQIHPDDPFINVVYQDTNRRVKSYANLTVGGVNYENVFMLKPGEIAEINFPEDSVYYYIKECGVDTEVYDQVTVNGESLTGTAAGTASSRQDYSFGCVDPSLDPEAPASGYLKINENPRAAFVNHVHEDVGQTLTFTKLLFNEDGTEEIHDCDETFSFRLYLGTENDDPNDLPLANMYKYHVKDAAGNYCRWDTTERAFAPLTGKTDYSALTDAEKAAVTFNTSMNGSISYIPVDYTVEVREMMPGTQYKVEERPWEVPDGYSLQKYVLKEDTAAAAGEVSTEPPSGVIEDGADPHVDVCNLKGWGLRVNKTWSDADFMEQRDPVYFAVYIEDVGGLTLLPDTVRRLEQDEDTLYWYFPTLGEYDFDQYVVREVLLNNPTVDDEGTVTDYDAISYIPEGGTFSVQGRKYGDSDSAPLTYKVGYRQGEMPQGANVRVDEATNSRQGVGLYKTDWSGEPLAGAVFTLTDGNGNDACGTHTLTSGEDGLITNAYLRPNETYTLTEIQSPTGYRALPAPLTVSVDGNDNVTVSGDTDWYVLEDGEPGLSLADISIRNKPYTVEMIKRDAAGAPLAGVHFALYRQVTDSHGQPRKDYEPIEGYEDLVTDANGLVPQLRDDFLSGALKPGTYYLYEKEPLEGYLPLSGDVLFTVDEKGVLTLDGSCPSDVSVSTSEGNTLQYSVIIPNESFETVGFTVRKEVAGGTTADLTGVTSFNFTAKLYMPDGLHSWDYTDNDFTHGTASFSLAHSEDGGKALRIPKGAIVRVTEDNPGSAYTTAYRLDGGETVSGYTCETGEITDDQTLVFINTRKTVTVTVRKTVVGNGGSFSFTAKLTDGGADCQGYALAGGIATGSDGTAQFTLTPAANGTKTQVLTVPYGAEITVSEANNPSYTTTYKLNNGSTVSGNSCSISGITSNQTLLFTNTQSGVSPTGYGGDDHTGAFQGLCLLGLALMASVVVPLERKRRKAAADGRRQV